MSKNSTNVYKTFLKWLPTVIPEWKNLDDAAVDKEIKKLMETDDGKEQVSTLMLTMFDYLSKSKGATNTYGDGGVIPKHQLGSIMKVISRFKAPSKVKKVMKQVYSHSPAINVTTPVPYRTLPSDVVVLPRHGEVYSGFSKSKYFPKTVRTISSEKVASEMLSNSLDRARGITEPPVSVGTAPSSTLKMIGKKVGNGLWKVGVTGAAGALGGYGLEWGRKKAASGEQYQLIDVAPLKEEKPDSTQTEIDIFMQPIDENAPSKQTTNVPTDSYFNPKF